MASQAPTQRTIGALEGKLDLIVQMMSDLKKAVSDDNDKKEEKIDKLHARVGRVENKLYWLSGAVFLAGFIISKIDFSKLFSAAAASL